MSSSLPGATGSRDFSRVRAARQRRLLTAARRTFLRDGYHGTTMERVAEDAGVSKQTLYNYFADKDALFVAVVEDARVAPALPRFEEALNRLAGGDVEEALCRLAAASLQDAGNPEQAGLFRLGLEVAADRPEVMATVRDRVVEAALRPFRAALARGVRSGHLRDVDVEVATLVFRGAIAAYLLIDPLTSGGQPPAVTPERMAAGLADLLAHGLARTPPPGAVP